MEANVYIPPAYPLLPTAVVETVEFPWWSQAQEGGVALPAEWRARTFDYRTLNLQNIDPAALLVVGRESYEKL